MIERIAVWTKSERGQDLIEYSLLAGIIASVLLTASMLVLTSSIQDMTAGIAGCIDWAGPIC
jgi:Flp pilus assembly pilin Flp